MTATTQAAEVPAFEGETVTRSLVRYLAVPGAEAEIALITLENGLDHKRPSTFGPAGLHSLDQALTEVFNHQPGVSAIAITGKPYVFAVGADLSGMKQLRSREDALAIARLGHRVFRRLRESPIPTFAFINGAALGGGLELALHCHYRTISTTANTIALPECSLGLIPGWGGSWLLPNLIGPENALKVIIENPLSQNKMLRASQAFKIGIADVLLEAADFLERSLEWAVGVVNGIVTVSREAITRDKTWDMTVLIGRKIVEERLHGAAPAPYRALDLIAAAKNDDYDTASAAEDQALADLLLTNELQASLYAFDLVQKRARKPAGAPDTSLARPVTKIGVVGAGLMASQLATLFAQRLEVPVVLTDVDTTRLNKGIAAAHEAIDGMENKGRISANAAQRYRSLITGSLGKEAFTDADFVIEAVFEDLAIKQQVFAEIEAVVGVECVLATNTSSLSVAEIAAGLRHPERVVGFHFFNPVAVLPLLEIVRAEQTNETTLATAFATAKSLKKSAVLVKDAPAFVVNRLLTRFIGDVVNAVDNGAEVAVADGALDELGLPMRPLALVELVGPAVSLHVAETLQRAYPNRFTIPELLRTAVEMGKNTLLAWQHGKQVIDPEIAAVTNKEHGFQEQKIDAVQLREYLLSKLAEEIDIMLGEGVVSSPQDIDLCMLLGAGWPFYLGGITPYLDRTGISEKVTGSRFSTRT